ncbi:unnamed protein product [Pleuronectes platessa]|uniref:ADAMTS/ADAMTS-like cysteine-rich domain-containing protein n=1 Tax=Pleuronectes platessa TaxID=8262 RepID=A0A9N7YYY7_PLEPL|nr:unnamed protein product [Pleuronectes platessa]
MYVLNEKVEPELEVEASFLVDGPLGFCLVSTGTTLSGHRGRGYLYTCVLLDIYAHCLEPTTMLRPPPHSESVPDSKSTQMSLARSEKPQGPQTQDRGEGRARKDGNRKVALEAAAVRETETETEEQQDKPPHSPGHTSSSRSQLRRDTSSFQRKDPIHQRPGTLKNPHLNRGTMKMLLPLVILQLLLAPALMVPSVDRWDTWAPYGECSRSCGSGVTMRTRRCITLRTDGGHNCVGPDKSYRSCNIQDCPEGSKDFREEQCSQFDGTNFQGKLYKWLPYYGAENPCELNCMPRGENFFYRHRSSVVDGTPCHPGRRDVCVDGVCKRLGCDNILESAQQEDPCLQCGGSGQSCRQVKNSFTVRDLPNGYNQMFIIPCRSDHHQHQGDGGFTQLPRDQEPAR